MTGPLTLVAYRGYIWRNALNDLRYRYAGSGMGVFWNVINPLVQVAVFGLIFGLMPAASRGPEGERWISLCLGLIPWLAFVETLVRASHSLVRGGGLIRMGGAPLEVLVAESALASALSALLAVAVLLVAVARFGGGTHPGLILLPLITLLLQAFAYGLGLILACLRAFFADTSEVLRVLLQLWMWTMPVVYSEALLPEWIGPWLVLNPPWAYIQQTRALGLGLAGFDPFHWLMMIVWALVSTAVGFGALNHLRRDVLDVV
jgi:ABC-type polysaccharide/polyol phosphate export permease